MSWVYAQRQGTLRHDGKLVCTGYSGHPPAGKNNPDAQAVHSVGPIPRGRWSMTEMLPDYPPHGQLVLRLQPHEGTETFGRDGFLVHGDMKDPALAGTASLGCIIVPRGVREEMWNSGDRDLEVVEDDEVKEE